VQASLFDAAVEKRTDSLLAVMQVIHASPLHQEDKSTKVNFLVDMGTDLCVRGGLWFADHVKDHDIRIIYTANESVIHIYGTETIILNLRVKYVCSDNQSSNSSII